MSRKIIISLITGFSFRNVNIQNLDLDNIANTYNFHRVLNVFLLVSCDIWTSPS